MHACRQTDIQTDIHTSKHVHIFSSIFYIPSYREHTHIYMCTYIHIHRQTDPHRNRGHMYNHMQISIRTSIDVNTYRQACGGRHKHTRTHTHTHTHACLSTYTRTYTHSYPYIHTHIYMITKINKETNK